jgi:hypothetical protein
MPADLDASGVGVEAFDAGQADDVVGRASKPQMAQAAGTDPGKIGEALARAKELIRAGLGG